MQARNTSSLILLYVGLIATALAVIALGLTTVVMASTAISQPSTHDKTALELQVESSREVRRALATAIPVPPLPTISPHLREAAMAQAKRPARAKAPNAAMDALAMDQSGTSPPPPGAVPYDTTEPQIIVVHATTRSSDRHAANW